MVIDHIGQDFNPFRRARIVSLVPSVTETLFDLGLDNEIIGVTRYCIYPSKAKEKKIVGGTKSPKIDMIKALNPDIIIVNKEENTEDDFQKLIKIAPTYVTYPLTVEDGINLIFQLGKLFEIENEIVLKQQEHWKNVLRRIKSSKFNPKTVFYPIWKDPWMTINHDTYIDSMLRRFNLQNIFSSHEPRYPKVNLDTVKSVIDMVLLPNEPYTFTLQDIADIRIYGKFNNSVFHLVDGSYLSWYGTRTIKGLEYMLNLLQ